MTITSELAENKLIILYLVQKMELPLSLSHIQKVALGFDFMDYFSLSTYIAELTTNEYLLKDVTDNKAYYTVSKKGTDVLNFFGNRIPNYIKEKIDKYISLNKKIVRKELDLSATYSVNDKGEYIVKCGVYENSALLIEVNVNVTSKEYARKITKNWKDNVNTYYPFFLKSLLSPPEIKE